jgi:hypothetical protein
MHANHQVYKPLLRIKSLTKKRIEVAGTSKRVIKDALILKLHIVIVFIYQLK